MVSQRLIKHFLGVFILLFYVCVNAGEQIIPLKPLNQSIKKARIWNLQEADILSVVNEVSQETGKNFIVDPRVSGKISLISSKPIPQTEVYDVFISVLSILGYSAIPSGSVIKIVPNMESGEMATKIAKQYNPGKGDEVVVRVVPLSHVSSTQLIPVLRPLLPQWSNIASYPPGNILILLGRAANLSRLVEVIQEIDGSANNNIQLVRLQHATATQVATVLTNLQNAARAAGDTALVSIAVDERSNSILLGGPKAMRLRLRLLISQLDTPSTASSGNTEVVYLKYLQAKNFAPLLGKIAQNILGKGANNQAENGSAASANIPPQNVGMYGISTFGKNNKNEEENEEAEEPVVINNGYIQAEPNTNAIVITAPPALMKALKAVIAKLDIRPAEVMVEAIIAEVDEMNLMGLGIQWGTVTDKQSGNNGTAPLVTAFPPYGAGVIGIIPGVQLKSVLSLLRNQNGVDILSTPSIMVLDNQKATIEIGQDVPTQNGSYASTGGVGTVQPFNTTEYKKVTLKLEVTPQINLCDAIRLKLKLKNDTLQNPQNPGLTPLINTSSINNSVMINNDDILVLGGLITNSNNENINKVPILGDLPILGPMLFQQKVSNQQRKTLIVFIKPIIVHNSQDAMIISHTKYNTIRQTQANFRDNLRTIGDEPVPTALTPWKNTRDLPKPFARL